MRTEKNKQRHSSVRNPGLLTPLYLSFTSSVSGIECDVMGVLSYMPVGYDFDYDNIEPRPDETG